MTVSRILEYLKCNSFWVVSLLTLGAIIGIDAWNWQDPCLVFYGLQWSISLICGIMFWDFLRKRQGASRIYWWITLLLFAIALDAGIMFVARYFLVYKGVIYATLVNSNLWNYRPVFKVLALMYLLWFAVKQRYSSGGTYYDGMRAAIENGFESLEAKIVDGEIKFEGHSHDGLVIGAKIILKAPGIPRTETVTETITTTTTTNKSEAP
jgi:hypothetical protein